MSQLVGNPEDQFSRITAHFFEAYEKDRTDLSLVAAMYENRSSGCLIRSDTNQPAQS